MKRVKQKARSRKIGRGWQRKAHATYGLIGLNLLCFALEMASGGSENLDTLYRLGGLVPPDVWAGQWWRLLNANFLHFGWFHLLTNMIGLYVLGAFVESYLGTGRYLLAYFVSGVGAMFVFSLLAMKAGNTEQILVGASAAIMGLLGVAIAIFLRDCYQEKSSFAARRLRSIFLIIGLQFAFDLADPQVSFLSHVLGLMIGFMTGILLLI